MSVGVAQATVVGLSVACDVRCLLRVGVGLTNLGGGVVGGRGCGDLAMRQRERSPVDSTAFIHSGDRSLPSSLHPRGDSLVYIASFTSLSLVDAAVSMIST